MKRAFIGFLWLLHSCDGMGQDISKLHPDYLFVDAEIPAKAIRENQYVMALAGS